MTKTQRDNLVIKHMDNVGRIAADIMRKLPVGGSAPVIVDIDDLKQSGMIGLVEAATTFDPSQGLKFWTFAAHRVRGAILDHLRSVDGAARSTRTIQKKADAYFWEHQRKFGTAPTDTEMAAVLEMTVERWLKWKVRLLYSSEISIGPKTVSADDEMPREFIDKRPLQDADAGHGEVTAQIHAALDKLGPKERQVLTEYFFSQKTLLQTGEMLGMKESRASQIKKTALLQMRELLNAAGIRRGTI